MLLYSHATHPFLSKLVAQVAGTFLVAAEVLVLTVVELVFRMFYFESSGSFLLCCIVKQILEKTWFVILIMLVLVFLLCI